MNKYFTCFLLSRLLVSVCLLSAQDAGSIVPKPSFVTEQILVQTDRQLYINGETIWFKVYVLKAGRNEMTDFSQVAYLELLNAEGLAVSQIKVLLEEGMGTGTIELPPVMNNGIFHLRAYTKGMRNEGENTFYTQELFILNPKQALVRAADAPAFTDEVVVFDPGIPAASIASANGMRINIKTRQTEYRQREKIVLELETSHEDGKPLAAQLSLSVVLKAPNSFDLFPSSSTRQKSRPMATPRAIKYLPEDRGMRLQGKVVREGTNEGIAGVEVFLAFPGKRALVYSTISGLEGEFSFLLPRMFGLKQVVVQIGEKEGLNLAVQLEEEFHPVRQQDDIPVAVLPTEWEDFANQVLVNAQIGQSYEAFDPRPAFKTPNKFEDISFFGIPDFNYQLDDFTRFPLPEFFYEVVLPVRVKGKFGEEEISVDNGRESPQQDLKPLLLVDGVPVFDQRTFLQINNKLIESAEIVLSPVWLNPGVFNGEIQISSFDGDARCFDLPETALRRSYLTLLPQKQFQSPEHEAPSSNSMPDFRNTLYWNPTIETDAKGKATIEFFSSDAIGAYEVKVEGVSVDGRQFGSESHSIGVVKPFK